MKRRTRICIHTTVCSPLPVLLAGLPRLRHHLPRPQPAAQQRLPLPGVRRAAVPRLPGAQRGLQPHGGTVPAARRLGGGRRLRLLLLQLRVQQGGGRVGPGPPQPDGRAVRLPPPHGVRRHRHPHRVRHPVLCHQMRAGGPLSCSAAGL